MFAIVNIQGSGNFGCTVKIAGEVLLQAVFAISPEGLGRTFSYRTIAQSHICSRGDRPFNCSIPADGMVSFQSAHMQRSNIRLKNCRLQPTCLACFIIPHHQKREHARQCQCQGRHPHESAIYLIISPVSRISITPEWKLLDTVFHPSNPFHGHTSGGTGAGDQIRSRFLRTIRS